MEERYFALLIDADNVSAKYITPILTELSKYGVITYKRIYGDWTSTLHSAWKEELLTNSIMPVQQFSYTTGKNATDSAMIIDAMDILYANDVNGFCIVSSDSDFTRLVSRLRESGKMVIGMGENKTPDMCHLHLKLCTPPGRTIFLPLAKLLSILSLEIYHCPYANCCDCSRNQTFQLHAWQQLLKS